MNCIHRAVNKLWYGKACLWQLVLWPFSLLYGLVVRVRRLYFRWRPSAPLPAPVLVVGNLNAGGSGKTPAVIGILELLSRHGFSPAVIGRGCGARQTVRVPQAVSGDTSPQQAGDEAVMIAQHGRWPVVVAANRYQAACYALKHYAVDLIVADDGLQHYALPRDVEIAVIDGQRRFGNGFLLPAGPLREPLSRLREVDCRIIKEDAADKGSARDDEHVMRIQPRDFVRLSDNLPRPLDHFAGQAAAAYAGIGHPESFFSTLEGLGLLVDPHPLPDHYRYGKDDCRAMARHRLVIMTEKDAVKCKLFVEQEQNLWFLRVDAVFSQKLKQSLLSLMSGTS